MSRRAVQLSGSDRPFIGMVAGRATGRDGLWISGPWHSAVGIAPDPEHVGV
jgi:hypothetical protein